MPDTNATESSAVDFSGLILGFSSAALSYLGYGPDGTSGGPKNPLLASQNIEIIKMLEAKTKGNLTTQETHLVHEVLRDLMTKYADCCGSSKES